VLHAASLVEKQLEQPAFAQNFIRFPKRKERDEGNNQDKCPARGSRLAPDGPVRDVTPGLAMHQSGEQPADTDSDDTRGCPPQNGTAKLTSEVSNISPRYGHLNPLNHRKRTRPIT
jgi:hypothetical protein